VLACIVQLAPSTDVQAAVSCSPAGIVGISAACLGAHVMLTDTRDILPQIMENVQENGAIVEAAGGSATVQELDWNQPDDEVRLQAWCSTLLTRAFCSQGSCVKGFWPTMWVKCGWAVLYTLAPLPCLCQVLRHLRPVA
jgi:hypothetical protein